MKNMTWGTIGLLFGVAAAGPAHGQQLESAAEVFGHRVAVGSIALSPSGNRVAYLGPGPGEETRAYVADVAGGSANVVTLTDGDPMELDWCRFVSEQRLVCQIYALAQDVNQIYPVTRMFALNDDRSEVRPLGQRDNRFRNNRQFDGSIIDWLPGEDDTVLMSRVYVPEGYRGDTRIVDDDEGLGVVRINTLTGPDQSP